MPSRTLVACPAPESFLINVAITFGLSPKAWAIYVAPSSGDSYEMSNETRPA